MSLLSTSLQPAAILRFSNWCKEKREAKSRTIRIYKGDVEISVWITAVDVELNEGLRMRIFFKRVTRTKAKGIAVELDRQATEDFFFRDKIKEN